MSSPQTFSTTGRTPAPPVIAVFGKTGTGKTTLVRNISGATGLQVGHGLVSCTQDVTAVNVTVDGVAITLVDTPGFDDTNLSDTEVLRRIAEWLKDTYDEGKRLTGLIYLHDISGTRMSGSSVKNLHMFNKLCGVGSFKNVLLVTTMWRGISQVNGLMREQELKDNFWKLMLVHGAGMDRVEDDRASAQRLIKRILQNNRGPTTLAIQEELSEIGLPLSQTAAGAALLQQLDHLEKKHSQDIIELKRELQESNKQTADALRAEIARLTVQLQKNQNEKKELKRARLGDLPKQRRSWMSSKWSCLKCINVRTPTHGRWRCGVCQKEQNNVMY